MKIKIKKEGKKKEYKLINNWSEVTLEKWVELSRLENGDKSKEALDTVAILSDIPKKLIKELKIQDIAVIMDRIADLQSRQNSSLKNIIEVDGKEYGFHPKLSDITLGEYADIETFVKNGIENSLPEVMAVLYRPIVERKNNKYIIEAYDGNIEVRAEIFKKMKAEQVQSALVFFYNLGKKLAMILPLYLMERVEEIEKKTGQKILQKNGGGSE
jgi:hypothetical protein